MSAGAIVTALSSAREHITLTLSSATVYSLDCLSDPLY